MPVKQLLLAKYLYRKGAENLDPTNSMACGLAISLFQDAVETVLNAVAGHLDVQVKENAPGFERLWGAISSTLKITQHPTLPRKDWMFKLNKARVSFKHHGNLPAPSEGAKFQAHTEKFLHETVKRFFDLGFDSISMAELIENHEIKDRLKEAEKSLSEGKIEDCLVKCAEAEGFISAPIGSLFPAPPWRITGLAPRSRRRELDDLLRYLRDYLGELRTLTWVSLVGINLLDYLKYRAMGVRAVISVSGKCRVEFTRSSHTEVDAKFCIDYLIDLAINVQDKLRAGKKFNV